MKRRTFLQIIGGIFGSVVAGGVVAEPLKKAPWKNYRIAAFHFHESDAGENINVWYKTYIPITPEGIEMRPSYITYKADIIIDVDTGEVLKNDNLMSFIYNRDLRQHLESLPLIENPGKISRLIGYEGMSFY